MADYIVRPGDTLWAIASAYKSKISGSTINAKIDTLVSVNKIKNRDLIYVGQGINFSGGGSSPTSSSANKVTIDALALQASDTTSGRSVYASWSWSKDNTKGFQYRWSQYKNGQWVANGDSTMDYPDNVTSQEDRDLLCYAEFTADVIATKVRFQILPIATTYKSGDKEVPHWKLGTGSGDVAWATKEYNFADNPPLPPGVPEAEFDELNDRKLVMSFSFTEADKNRIGATAIKFNIVKNNTTSVYTSDPIPVQKKADDYYFVSHPKELDYGGEYKVRACSVNAKNKSSAWSGFSNVKSTRPVAPKKITDCRCDILDDGTFQVHLEWEKVANAAQYVVEYHTNRTQLEQGQIEGSETTIDARTYIDILGLSSGKQYFFRVKAANAKGESNPTDIVTLAVGDRPAAPTTWSSAKSAFVGESMELNWTHNTVDGSAQTFAEFAMKINNGEWKSYTFKNETSPYKDDTVTKSFTYGTVVSYKGDMHVKIDTTHGELENSTVAWKVRTIGIKGVTGTYNTSDYSEWSADDRTFNIYTLPTLELSLSRDLAGEEPFEDVEIPPEETGGEPYIVNKALTSFPFYIRANVTLNDYTLQRPIGYYLQIIAEDSYETVDDAGRSKTVNPGDAVYSKYFTVPVENPILIVVMSAENIDLEPLIRYTVKCEADMSTGMAVPGSDEFNVLWADVEYQIKATIIVNEDTYAATIIPTCEDLEGNLIENVSLAIYRREYNGSLTEIASNIPNNGTAVSDPHPSLDYARYRLIAKDDKTGAISFFDMGGHYVGCPSVIVQWAEDWTPFDSDEQTSMEMPSGSGSMLVLPYNVKVSDSRQREVSLVNYAGREYPVSYHGTSISEKSSWSTVIPKDDADTIYALRRLSLWNGPVYIREPSGMGFWATVIPSFNIDHKSVSIPVTLEVTRVEGGV